MLNRTSLTDRRKYYSFFTGINIVLVATQRTGLPTSETIGLGMLPVVLPNEANVHCYSDLHSTKLYSQWLGYSLAPVRHLTTTSSPTTIRFGNSHNIPNFLRKYVKGCTLQYYVRWEMYNAWLGTAALLAIWLEQYTELIKTQNFWFYISKWIHTKWVMKICEMLKKKATYSFGWKLCFSCIINAKIYWF